MDHWRFDPRIFLNQRMAEAFYTHNAFDRGHLTRREGQEYGALFKRAVVAEALAGIRWIGRKSNKSLLYEVLA